MGIGKPFEIGPINLNFGPIFHGFWSKRKFHDETFVKCNPKTADKDRLDPPSWNFRSILDVVRSKKSKNHIFEDFLRKLVLQVQLSSKLFKFKLIFCLVGPLSKGEAPITTFKAVFFFSLFHHSRNFISIAIDFVPQYPNE